MKTSLLLFVGALAGTLLLPTQGLASPGGFSGRLTPYRSYAADGISEFHLDSVPYGGPRKWSFGGYADLQRRRVELDGPGSTEVDFDAESFMLTLGYDVVPPVTLLAGIGSSDPDLGATDYGSGAVALFGARVRLLDYFVFDPMKLSDVYWLRLDAVMHYQRSETDRGNRDLEWDEWRAALTANFVSRPMQLRYFDSVGLYFGPVASYLTLRETNPRNRWEGKDNIGMVAGIFVNPSRHTMLKVELNRFERNSFNLSAGFHF